MMMLMVMMTMMQVTTIATTTGPLSEVYFPSVIVCSINQIRKSLFRVGSSLMLFFLIFCVFEKVKFHNAHRIDRLVRPSISPSKQRKTPKEPLRNWSPKTSGMSIFILQYSILSILIIPDICPIFYTITIQCLEILHLKLCKFATKVAS